MYYSYLLMNKEKIAISLEKTLLQMIDTKIDGTLIRSRSQAIEYYLKKGLCDCNVNTGVILLHKSHHKNSLKNINGKALLTLQLEHFHKYGLNNILIITQHSNLMNDIMNIAETLQKKMSIRIIEKDVKGNCDALRSSREEINQGGTKENFVVISGDILNEFNIGGILAFHQKNSESSSTIATIGLMERDDSSKYGNVTLDGDKITEFVEKPKSAKTHIVNAGFYVMNQRIFEYTKGVSSLEREVFSKLAQDGKLRGYFTKGEYIHVCE